MAPYHNLPELLRPIHPPHHPDPRKHDGHDHPHPRPSLRVTTIGMALLSAYVILLVSMALFTMWRIGRKRARMESMSSPGPPGERVSLGGAPSRGEELGFRTYGFGAGGAGGRGLSKMKGMVKSREMVRRGGSGSGIPNTHLSHEDIEDTEETALLPQSLDVEEVEDAREDGRRVELSHVNQEDDVTGKGWNYLFTGSRFGMGNWFMGEPNPPLDGRIGDLESGRTGGGSNINVPEGLRRAAERGEGIFA